MFKWDCLIRISINYCNSLKLIPKYLKDSINSAILVQIIKRILYYSYRSKDQKFNSKQNNSNRQNNNTP